MTDESQTGRSPFASVSAMLSIAATIFAVATLYAPQPLLGTFAMQFGLSKTSASLAVTLTLLPLAIAPIVYGLLLESVSAGRLASAALLIIAAGHVGVALSTSWPMLLGFRFLQGLAVPAVLTSVMTLLSESVGAARVRRVMALYICATIFGGFFGRLGAGTAAWAWGWQAPFLFLSCLCLLTGIALLATGVAGSAGFARPEWSKVGEALARPSLRRIYLMIFCCFYTFTATLNFLPFRLAELEGGVNELRTGIMYLGYIVGMLTAIGSTWLSGRWGEGRSLRMGILLFGLSVAACAVPSGDALLAILFPFCGGFFLVQATGPGVVNARVTGKKGVVNGLYIAFYYGGGTLGSFAPGFIYHHFGWSLFIASLVVVVGLAWWLARGVGSGAGYKASGV